MIFERTNSKGLTTVEIVRPLAQHVLAVALVKHVEATTGWCGDWAAYIDAVPGMNHREEWIEVLAHGEKLPADVAQLLFPEVEVLNCEREERGLRTIHWRA